MQAIEHLQNQKDEVDLQIKKYLKETNDDNKKQYIASKKSYKRKNKNALKE